MNAIARRLRMVREKSGHTLRDFALIIHEDFTLLDRIETGQRYPPRSKLEKYAGILALSTQQLRTLMGIDKAGLNSDILARDIPPPHIPQEDMERQATDILNSYRSHTEAAIPCPVPLRSLFQELFALQTRFLDFETEKIRGVGGSQLYGCLYPEGYFFRGEEKLILVNIGLINHQRLTPPQLRISLAHEGSHYVLHCPKQKTNQLPLPLSAPNFCSSIDYRQNPFDPREFQATLLASCLLMPREELLCSAPIDLQNDGYQLCQRFGVTSSFLRFRLKSFGLNLTTSSSSSLSGLSHSNTRQHSHTIYKERMISYNTNSSQAQNT